MKKTLIAASLGLTLLAGTSSVFAHDYDHHRSSGDVVAATMIGAIAGALLSQNTGYSYDQPYGYPAYYNTPTYYYQTPVVNGYYGRDWHHRDRDWHHHDRDWHHHDRDYHDHDHHDWRR